MVLIPKYLIHRPGHIMKYDYFNDNGIIFVINAAKRYKPIVEMIIVAAVSKSLLQGQKSPKRYISLFQK